MATTFLFVLMACHLAVVYSYGFPDCVNGPLAKYPVCDPSLGYRERATDLISRFTVLEKLANFLNGSPGVSRLGLPAYQWWSEALHGIAGSPGVNFAKSGNFSSASSFPMPIGLGAAFDDNLIYLMGNVIGTEARAFNNVNRAGLDFWTPNINPFRDPRWGRGPETPGEDPFHLQSYVYNLIIGLESGEDTRYKKVIADCKHFAAYDMENSDHTDRYDFNAVVTLQDLVEYYLPPFESCVRNAKVGSIMCSYNAVNGVPSCANSYLLQTIAREHWGMEKYDGWVTSDCDAIMDIYVNHHYTKTPEETVAAALLAGTDIDCGSYYEDHLPAALNQSLITEADLDRALIREYSSLIQLGYFDPASSQPYRKLSWADVNTPASQQLAYTAAVESITLLKNDGLLPLTSTDLKSVALIGPWGEATQQMQGNYYGNAPYLISPLAALQNAKIQVVYVQGCSISGNDTSGFDAAVKAAQSASVVIFAGGPDNSVESEARDRTSITWPGVQLQLIQTLEKVGNPIVVIQLGGGQVDDTYLKMSKTINALIWAGYPGQSGGSAIVDVLTGTYAPAGRLPVTQYPAEYTNQVNMTDMTLRPSSKNPGRTYKWYSGEAVYQFGYGLHYTSFEFDWDSTFPTEVDIASLINVHAYLENDLDQAPLTTYAVNVTNTGKVTSDVVVLLFVNSTLSHPEAPSTPLRELIAYDRPHLIKPSETRVVYFTLTLRSLSRADENGHLWLFPGKYRMFIDYDAQIEHTFILTGEPALLRAFPQPPSSATAKVV